MSLQSCCSTLSRSLVRTNRLAVAGFAAAIFAGACSPALAQASNATVTTLTTSTGGSAQPGEVETLTARVTNNGDSLLKGQVTFYDGKVALGSAQLGVPINKAEKQAVFKTRFGPGVHTLTASFAGTTAPAPGYMKSSSAVQTVIVMQPTPVSLTLSAVRNNPYTLTAVTLPIPGTIAPTGFVSILDTTNNNLPLGSLSLVPSIAPAFGGTISEASPGHLGVGIVTGDFNGDGILDVAVTGINNVTVLFGSNGGAGTSSAILHTGINPVAVTAGTLTATGPSIWPSSTMDRIA